MKSNNVFLGQETESSVFEWVDAQLNIGASVYVVAQSMLGTQRADIVITKWYGASLISLSKDQQIGILKEYVETEFKHKIGRSCISSEIQKLIQENFKSMNPDDYSDHLSELMMGDEYRNVNHNITSILSAFKLYMMDQKQELFINLNPQELEVELVAFIKKHLQICTGRKE